MSSDRKTLFCFGFGYTCSYLSEQLLLSDKTDWKIKGTTRDPDKKAYYKEKGISLIMADMIEPIENVTEALQDATHILISTPPDKEGDAVYRIYGDDIRRLPNLKWVGYLSTTGVYGDRQGAEVDENAEIRPSTIRGSRRALAESQWRSLNYKSALPIHLMRLSGIYGPERSAIDSVRAGIARRIYKEGHKFNRIHVDDIVNVLIASMNKPTPGEAYNLADDEPTGSHDVIDYACQLLGVDAPPLVPIEKANLAPITMSFYSDHKHVLNNKIKDVFGIDMVAPTYREGLKRCLDKEK